MTVDAPATSPWPFDDFVDIATAFAAMDPPLIEGSAGPTIRLGDQDLVNFAGINFLDVEAIGGVRENFAAAVERHGLVTGGSRMSQGIMRPHWDLERELCRITGKERAITFASGMLANLGFANALTHHMRMETGIQIDFRDVAFVLDRDSHWSLWKAVEHLEYGKKLFAFRHNDAADLENILRRMRGRRTVVAMESVYSTDGTVAPMGDLIDVCEKYGALSFVDDANGFMVYGPPHRPFAAEFEAMRRATFVMVSFSKSVGLEGGAIAGPAGAILAFELLSGTSMFTAAMQPPTASAATHVLSMLDSQPAIVDDYLSRVQRFRSALSDIGCQLNESGTYITSVRVGVDGTAYELRERFLELGYQVPVFSYPAVRRNNAVLRLLLNAGHTDDQLAAFVDTLAGLKRSCGF